MEKKASDFYLKHHKTMKGRKARNSQWIYKHPAFFVAALLLSLGLPVPLGVIFSVLYMENNRRLGIWVLLSAILGGLIIVTVLMLLFFDMIQGGPNIPDNV